MFWGGLTESSINVSFKGEKKTELLENFKTAIGSTVKSISNSDDVEVSFGNQSSQSKILPLDCQK